MIIKSLWLNQFRNIEQGKTEFCDNLNIFIGNNGQGKTNFLEAIYLLLAGQSFRYANNDTFIELNKTEALIKALIQSDNLEFNLKLKFFDSKKELFLNEKKITNEKLNLPPAILFSPESLNIIKESSDERRNLIDQLVIQINRRNKPTINDFKRILKTRNKLLKEILKEKIDRKMGIETLASINTIFIKLAAEVTFLRLKALLEIEEYVTKSLCQIHEDVQIKFDYRYVISDRDYKKAELEEVYDTMHKRMQELEKFELSSGVSLVGPQKHDVIFIYNGNDSRFYCSQGQQRSIILAFKMAQIVYHHKLHGYYPVLLLDDVLSELDLNKQESLISTLNQTETQTFVSTTDVSLISKLSMSNSRVFKIKNGQIFI